MVHAYGSSVKGNIGDCAHYQLLKYLSGAYGLSHLSESAFVLRMYDLTSFLQKY